MPLATLNHYITRINFILTLGNKIITQQIEAWTHKKNNSWLTCFIILFNLGTYEHKWYIILESKHFIIFVLTWGIYGIYFFLFWRMTFWLFYISVVNGLSLLLWLCSFLIIVLMQYHNWIKYSAWAITVVVKVDHILFYEEKNILVSWTDFQILLTIF